MFSPDIFADRDADLFAAEIQRRNRTRRLEITVFIENIIGRQKGFVCFANWLSRFEEGCSIMKWFAAALIPIDKPDEQRCPTNMLCTLCSFSAINLARAACNLRTITLLMRLKSSWPNV